MTIWMWQPCWQPAELGFFHSLSSSIQISQFVSSCLASFILEWVGERFILACSVSVCVHKCLCEYGCMRVCAHVCLEARGHCWYLSLITLYFNFWRQSLSLNLKLMDSVRLADQWASETISTHPTLRSQMWAATPGFYMRPGNLNSGPRAWVATLYSLTELSFPSPVIRFLFKKSFILYVFACMYVCVPCACLLLAHSFTWLNSVACFIANAFILLVWTFPDLCSYNITVTCICKGAEMHRLRGCYMGEPLDLLWILHDQKKLTPTFLDIMF